jgi:hypothetical protein
MFSKVDLPEPDGPSGTTNRPSGSTRLMLRRACLFHFAHSVHLRKFADIKDRRHRSPSSNNYFTVYTTVAMSRVMIVALDVRTKNTIAFLIVTRALRS